MIECEFWEEFKVDHTSGWPWATLNTCTSSFDSVKALQLAPKLTESLLSPSHLEEMSVSNAMKVFSNATSSALPELVNHPAEFMTTAWFIEKIRRWLDLNNSSSPTCALGKQNVDNYNEEIDFWNGMVSLF